MSANNLPINFSYAKWTPNTRFKLCNVPWDMGYRDIVKWDRQSQKAYFDRLDGIEFTDCTMAKYGLPVRLPIPFAQASQYNYLIATNDYDFDTPRSWYYFVQTCDYVNAHTTQLNIQLDVWQSFQHDIRLGNAYVERGHVGVANENAWKDWGKTYLDLPEGLDTGKCTVLTNESWKPLIGSGNSSGYAYGIIIAATTRLEVDPGNKDNPTVESATGSTFENQMNGTELYYLDNPSDIFVFFGAGRTCPWVTQGICGIYMVPPLPNSMLEGHAAKNPNIFGTARKWNGTCWLLTGNVSDSSARYADIINLKNFRNAFQLPERYKHLKKFLTAPYAYVECSCLNGTVITYEPEQIPSADLIIRETWNYAPPSPRLNFYARGYHAGNLGDRQPLPGGKGLPIDTGEMLNASFGITNFPTFMAVNNGSALALANSAYTRQYAQQSADWTYQKTQMGINNAYAQAQLGTQYASAQNRLGTSNRNAMNAISNQSAQMGTDLTLKNLGFNNQMAQLNTIGSGIANAAGSAVTGNIGGVAGAVAGTAIGAWTNQQAYNNNVSTANQQLANTQTTNNASTSQANAYSLAQTNLSNQQTMQLADMNKQLAQATAQGDYENTIAGINAQVQQTQTVPPTTSGALGGDAFNLANGLIGVMVRFRQIPPAAMQAIGEVWLRYGYYVQRFMRLPENLMTMSNFTYWKLHELYVRSSTCPEEYRLTVKGIFESGVTVWTDPDKIGVTDYADNVPLSGISY
nr:MAG TPA: Major tail protein [Caudoviricetes sp.]